MVDGIGNFDEKLIQETNVALVQGCARMVPVGTTQKAVGRFLQLCRQELRKESKGWMGGNFEYRISRLADGIHVGLNIRFQINLKSTDPGRSEKIMEQIRACVPKIREVWQKYGIQFDLGVDSTERPLTKDPVAVVSLSDGEGKSDAAHYYLKNEELCPLILHESSHLLGLYDEYEDKERCPDRPFIFERRDNVMNDPEGNRWKKFEFLPRDIRLVLEPLCTGRSAEWKRE